MPDSRNEWWLSLVSTTGLVVLLALAPAVAQVGPPKPLQPAADNAPVAPDVPPNAAPVDSAPRDSTRTADESIKATPLAPVDPAWIGTLGGADHPLPQSMWEGTPRALVAAALPQLAPSTSPSLRSLTRRLLLSNAVAPQGQDTTDHPSLAALRVERVMALGDVEEALALLDALPTTMSTEDLDRRRIELHFAKNDVDGACHQVQESVAHYQGVWWDRVLIACQALGGDQAKASLGLGLLREQKVPRDPAFDTLIDALSGHPGKLSKLPDPTPTRVALVAAAKLPLPADTIGAADLPTLRAWIASEAVPPLQRLAAAERAATLGALSPEALGALYAKVQFKPDELGAAIKQEKVPETPRDRALLYAVARTDPAVSARAKALKSLLTDAKKRDEFVLFARLIAPLLSDLPPSQDLADFAPDAIRALCVAGQPDTAQAWIGFVDAASAPGLKAIIHLARIKSGADDKDRKVLHDGIAALAQRNAKQAALLVALAAALNEPVEASDLALLLAPPHDASLPSAAVWIAHQRAVSEKHVGETVLMTLLLARLGDHLATEPIVIGRAVAGLKAVGFDAEAQALALEAALAGGI